MSEKNQQLYDAALKAATELFNDRSVSTEETKARLELLTGEIEVFIQALDADLERQEQQMEDEER